ncbi:carboxymuconolactone decarboxylase family protein [Micromonospora sp. NBC_01699]|uniref:carboxymuconolactone decarboxylase family protein n=1 Tax=Micromonospora sp. NBC_01699 TaxID=2975984 RepID=UPI002E36727F|nr:carboxymuconolactone decarboxylase family protein [Micromonospora sp. NBC_01699]
MVVKRIAASVVQRQVKYVTPVPVAAARGTLGEVYAQVSEEMGLVVPPVQLHSPVPDLAAAYWMLMRETLLPVGAVDRQTKEAVATAVSVANICPYCVDMHSLGMYELGTEHDAEALVADKVEELDDEHTRLVATWARVAHQPEAALAGVLPFGPAERAELVGVVVAMHYLSRMVNVFLSSFLIPPRLNAAGRRRFKRGASIMLRSTLRAERLPGRSVELLPSAPLPSGAEWAAGDPAIASAVGRADATFEAAGVRSLTPTVRDLVRRRLGQWRGEETGLSRRWCERLVEEMPPAEQVAARLALLTAFASYQVDEHVVREFRTWHPDDTALLDVTAWASYVAARQVGTWYAPATLAAGPVEPSPGR